MQIGFKTDTGKVRAQNEDTVYASHNFAVVADGMGGHNKGEIASKIVVDTLKQRLDHTRSSCKTEEITTAIRCANTNVFEQSVSDSSCAGMGTTVVAAIWDGENIIIGHVGDSRCYLIHQHEIQMLTKDHTLLQSLMDEGKFEKDSAADCPERHILTRAIGTDSTESPDVLQLAQNSGQYLVLCSDGLTNHVSDDAILACVDNHTDAQTIADVLVDMANADGGSDNISVAVVGF